jgi:glycosyltransferase involved in cell wall biosynthesis
MLSAPPSPALRVAVVQDGTRLHYAVPVALHRAGALHVMFSEWFLKRGIPGRVFRQLMIATGQSSLRGLTERRCDEIPPSLVRTNLLLVAYQQWVRRKPHSSEMFWEFCSRTTGSWILRHGTGNANALFGFVRNIDPRVVRAAQSRGLLTVADQMIAPAVVEAAEAAVQAQRWPDWEQPRHQPDYPPVQDVERRTWDFLDRITCASDYVRRGLLAQGIGSYKITLNPYPLEIGNYSVPNRTGRRGPLIVGFLGAVGLRKGAPYFIEVARRLNSPNVRFVMAGHKLLSEFAAKSIPANVELLGAVPGSQVPSYLEKFDIFLLPTTCEGSSVAVMEAIASGLPVITTPNAGSVIRDGIDGFLCDYDDIDNLAERVQRLITDESLRQQIGTEARRSGEQLTVDAYGKKLVDLMQSAMTRD